MVLVEELADDDEEVETRGQFGQKENQKVEEADLSLADRQKAWLMKENSVPTKPALNKGFLNQAHESLYPEEGSAEGKVADETKKAHAEHGMNEKLNDGMNRGAVDNNGFERPGWYTKEWPKDCQYNSPGCALEEMPTSSHQSEMHKEMNRKSMRWQEAFAPGAKHMRMSFMQVCDEDVADLIPKLKGNEDITELDLSHNKIKDAGIQALVGALSNGSAPNLQELRVYNNEFGELGKIMLTKGLPVFRKKLKIVHEEPKIGKLGMVQ